MKAISITPPNYLFLAIVIMVLLHFLVPGVTLLNNPWRFLGALPLALGILLNLIANRSFKVHRTTVKPLEVSTALIVNGVFQVTRHPMYLGFVLILFGIATLMGSLTPYFVVFVFAVFMDRAFIRFEEHKLEETFGEIWLTYKRRVRRWI
jgi:protein-S-isoprenylcysteine O-methyltransferase Ste14